MNKKLLCCALLGALGLSQVAAAQEYDDRWYVSGDVGYGMFDSEREVENSPVYKIGFGRFFAPKWSWDVSLNSANPEKNSTELNWSMYGVDLTGRYHFGKTEGRQWWPYAFFGVGALRHEEEISNPGGGRPVEREDTNFALHSGLGLQADFGRVDARMELGARFDLDDGAGSGSDNFTDFIASIGVTVALGPEPQPPVEPTPEPTPVVTTCADLDDDGDGVNNCEDRCPNSTAGQTIGPDGCPVPVTIDLRGVNFDFDKATLRPDAIATLNEAVSVLTQYSDLKVEVAGHTDECGADDYNQTLSGRRAAAVYDFLTGHGIDAGRLVGPNGYGESRPLEALGDKYPACKSETNRRTELNVQN